jgi:uncharacterized membrane protein YidH (DUF202 family)
MIIGSLLLLTDKKSSEKDIKDSLLNLKTFIVGIILGIITLVAPYVGFVLGLYNILMTVYSIFKMNTAFKERQQDKSFTEREISLWKAINMFIYSLFIGHFIYIYSLLQFLHLL